MRFMSSCWQLEVCVLLRQRLMPRASSFNFQGFLCPSTLTPPTNYPLSYVKYPLLGAIRVQFKATCRILDIVIHARHPSNHLRGSSQETNFSGRVALTACRAGAMSPLEIPIVVYRRRPYRFEDRLISHCLQRAGCAPRALVLRSPLQIQSADTLRCRLQATVMARGWTRGWTRAF